MSPTIIIVPGYWEGPEPFERLKQILTQKGFLCDTAVLPSTGTVSPGSPTMSDDIAAIRALIARHVEQGEEVVLFPHSAGGFLSSAAIESLTVRARKDKGLEGGVKQFIYMTAGLLPEGAQHEPLPFLDFQDGAVKCKDPRNVLFNDLDDETAAIWIQKLQTQPTEGVEGSVNYCGWTDVPSVYILCEKDACIPAELQLQIAGLAGSKVKRLAAGHMAALSQPEKVAELIVANVA